MFILHFTVFYDFTYFTVKEEQIDKPLDHLAQPHANVVSLEQGTSVGMCHFYNYVCPIARNISPKTRNSFISAIIPRNCSIV